MLIVLIIILDETFEMCSQLNEDEEDVDDDSVDDDEDYDICSCNVSSNTAQISSNDLALASQNNDYKNAYRNESLLKHCSSSSTTTPISNNIYYSKNLLHPIQNSNTANVCKHIQKIC